MKLGIDVGRARLVVAAADRGNYPAVRFETQEDASEDWFPAVIAVRGEDHLYGWDAWTRLGETDWTILRWPQLSPSATSRKARAKIPNHLPSPEVLLTELAGKLRADLVGRSTLLVENGKAFEVCLGVPQSIDSSGRLMLLRAFRLSGFQVLGMSTQPYAAAVRFVRSYRTLGGNQRSAYVLIYHLGDDCFDASLLKLSDPGLEVVDTSSLLGVGADRVDEILAEMALDRAGISRDERDGLAGAELFRLQEQCRQSKEALCSSTRGAFVDLGVARDGWGVVSLPVADFYERCRPLIDKTLDVVKDLLQRSGLGIQASLASNDRPCLERIYVAGIGSELPIVAQVLRGVFGPRVRGSASPGSSAAVGLAILADSVSWTA